MTEEQAIELAEKRQSEVDPYDLNPEQIAREVVDEVGGDVHYIKDYIQDRMWHRRGA